MTTIDISYSPCPPEPHDDDGPLSGDYDFDSLPSDVYSQARLGAGTVRLALKDGQRLGGDIVRVLRWAKQELRPLGQYEQYVRQALKMSLRSAYRLLRLADATTNDAGVICSPSQDLAVWLAEISTTDEDRAWALEREQAGQPTTREERRKRKRRTSDGRQPQPVEMQALAILRKDGELQRLAAAVELATQATIVTAEEVMAEHRMRDLGKLRAIPGMDADFHRLKDGTWARIPHAPATRTTVDIEPQTEGQQELMLSQQTETDEVIAIKEAEQRFGIKWLSQNLTPAAEKKRGGPLKVGGLLVQRAGHGKVRLSRADGQASR